MRVTLTHLVGAALGRALRAVPEARARVVFGRVVPIEDCTVAFAVDIENGEDLGPVRVEHADRATTVEVARQVEERPSPCGGTRTGTTAGRARSCGWPPGG